MQISISFVIKKSLELVEELKMLCLETFSCEHSLLGGSQDFAWDVLEEDLQIGRNGE